MFLQKPPESIPDLMAHLHEGWLERWGRSAARRFQEKIICHEDCWLWIGPVWEQHNHLPLFWLERWQRSARRVAWEMRHGLLPTHEAIRPICERPLCVNPAHAQVQPIETPLIALSPMQIQEVRALIVQQFCPLDVAPHCGVAVEVVRRIVADVSNPEVLLFAPQVESHPHARSGLSERERQMLAHWLQQRGEPLSVRERLLLVRRFGLDGQAPQTLDALIAPLGITTRERVRQIEGQALRKLHLPTQRQALRAKLDQLAEGGE